MKTRKKPAKRKPIAVRSTQPLGVNLVKNLKPVPGQIIEISDAACSGLTFTVTETGAKTWYYRPSFNGRQLSRYKIGSYPSLSLKQAREKTGDHLEAFQNGLDPREKPSVADRVKTSKNKPKSWTLREAVAAWAADCSITHRRKSTVSDYVSVIENHIYPYIEPRSLAAKLTREQLRDALESCVQGRKWSTFDGVQKRVVSLCNFLARTDTIYNHLIIAPGYFTKSFSKYAKKKGDSKSFPIVPVTEMPKFFDHFMARANRDTTTDRRTGHGALAIEALLFTALTAARTTEVIGYKEGDVIINEPATWREVDFKARTWTIGGSRYKNGRDHVVPLSSAAIKLLKQVKLKSAFTGPNDYIFHSHATRTGDGRPSNTYMNKRIMTGPKYPYRYQDFGKDSVIKLRPPTVHGLRGTFVEFGVMAGFRELYISISIGHKPKIATDDKAWKNYFDNQLLPERAVIMEAYGRYCTTGKTPKGWRESLTDAELKTIERLVRDESA